MGAIFISYRREDSEGQAGRLYDDLAEHFGPEAVFMDVAGIEPGRDFRRVIDERVSSCAVLLAVIGKGWLAAVDERGTRRLDDAADFVRLETASALRRDIPVVPVLVHGARMPRSDDLPEDLADLAYRNGVELTHARWASDVQVLLNALRPYVAAPSAGATTSVAQPESTASAAVGQQPSPMARPASPTMPSTPPSPTASPSPTGAQPAISPLIAQPGMRKPPPRMLMAGAAAAVVAIGLGIYLANRGGDGGHTDSNLIVADTAPVTAPTAVTPAAPVASSDSPNQTNQANQPNQAVASTPETTQQAETPANPAQAPANTYQGASGRAEETAASTDTQALPPPRSLRWRMGNFPPPNAGKVLFTVMPSGDPACMSYDGRDCLWGVLYNDIDFSKVKPLICGDYHKAIWGATGYEDPKHWCSLVRNRAAAR